jgi:hypothetical protein
MIVLTFFAGRSIFHGVDVTKFPPSQVSFPPLLRLLIKRKLIDSYLMEAGVSPKLNHTARDSTKWRTGVPKSLESRLTRLDDWVSLVTAQAEHLETKIPKFTWPDATTEFLTRLECARGMVLGMKIRISESKVILNILSAIFATMTLFADCFELSESEARLREQGKADRIQGLIQPNTDAGYPLKALSFATTWTPLMMLLPIDLGSQSVRYMMLLEVGEKHELI